jgi:hypothetical protein
MPVKLKSHQHFQIELRLMRVEVLLVPLLLNNHMFQQDVQQQNALPKMTPFLGIQDMYKKFYLQWFRGSYAC